MLHPASEARFLLAGECPAACYRFDGNQARLTRLAPCLCPRMLAEGLSLKEIIDHLDHRNLRSTLTYTKVHLRRLREVGDFDLGGLQ